MEKSIIFIKEIAKGIGCLVLYISLSFISILLFKLLGLDITKYEQLIRIIDMIISIVVFSLIFKKTLKEDSIIFKKDLKNNIIMASSCWVKGLAIMLIANTIINFFLFPDSLASNEESNRELINMYPLYSALSVIFVAPFIEELIFRRSYRKAFNKIKPYCICSFLVFGLVHVLFSITNIKELVYVIPYGALGYYFAYAYYKTNTIYTSILMHMIHNGMTFLLILFI